MQSLTEKVNLYLQLLQWSGKKGVVETGTAQELGGTAERRTGASRICTARLYVCRQAIRGGRFRERDGRAVWSLLGSRPAEEENGIAEKGIPHGDSRGMLIRKFLCSRKINDAVQAVPFFPGCPLFSRMTPATG